MSKVLVVYFSETGHTAHAAKEVARRLGGDLERILPLHPRNSMLSKVWAALLGRTDAVYDPARDPADYDLVVIATPVWAGRLPPSVRGYLENVRGRLGQVGFVATCGGAGTTGILRRLRNAVGRDPVAQVVITETDRQTGGDADKVTAFTRMVHGRQVAA